MVYYAEESQYAVMAYSDDTCLLGDAFDSCQGLIYMAIAQLLFLVLIAMGMRR
jgi:hypothetical protein